MGAKSFALVLCSFLVGSVSGFTFAGQDEPFSSTAQYQAMLGELNHKPIRPSRIGAGMLPNDASSQVRVARKETASRLILDTAAWRLDVSKERWGMALTNKLTGLTWQLVDLELKSESISSTEGEREPQQSVLRLGRIEHVENRGNSWELQVKVEGSSATLSLELTAVRPQVIRLSIRSPKLRSNPRLKLNFVGAGPFFGLGERFSRAKLDGLRTILRPEDLLGRRDHNWTYIPVPFLFTPHGLGLYLDTGDISTFDLSASDQQRFSIELDQLSADCYFFVEDTPKDILADYTSLTGRSPVPPPWAFGVWICSYQGPEKVLADARKLRENQIPSSAIWVYDVMGHGDIMGWPLWWTGYYPRPRQLTDQLHELGFKVLTYTHSYVRSVLDPYTLPNPSFEEGVRERLFVLNAAGQPSGPGFERYVDGNVDFTSPRAVNWWEKKIKEIVVDYNFDGWMEDFGEWVNNTDHFAAGKSGQEMANIYPLFYHKITYEIAKKAKPDVVEFVRSGYAGSQGYTRVVWGGDQFPDWTSTNGLPSVVPAGITAGLSGFSIWGPDIADNGHSKELWIRWLEFGALTPIMRNHLWDKPPSAINLWYDAETLDLFRRYARLHVSLFPYFYTYAHEAAKSGLPIIRHPMLEFPNDPKAYDAEQEYLLGDKILVAPVIEPQATERSLYLPSGSWVDYWTGQIIEGGRQLTLSAPLEHIPMLVRAGSIVPFIESNTETLAQDLAGGKYSTLTNDLIWRVFPAAKPVKDTFALYDGTVATAEQDSPYIRISVDKSLTVHAYELIVADVRSPREITLNGKSVRKLDEAGHNTRQSGWWVNAGDDSLHVLFSTDNFDLRITKQ